MTVKKLTAMFAVATMFLNFSVSTSFAADKKVITAVGYSEIPKDLLKSNFARSRARQFAKINAMRNLVETIDGVYIESNVEMVGKKVSSEKIISSCNTSELKRLGKLKGAKVVDVKFLDDGDCKVKMEMPSF